jgi:hypothetical protein
MQDQVTTALAADEAEEDLVQQLLLCSDDPRAFVNLAFPDVRLEEWQRWVLETIGNQLQENARLDRWKAVKIATASGNGIGKTACLAWIVLWGLITFEDTVSVVTAGSETQLRTRLWSELSKWHSQLPKTLRDQFTLTATSLFATAAERTWRCDARPWTERNKEAFSGVHNFRKRVVIIFDECAMIPDSIWDATSAMLSDAETEIVWAVFGNPTRNTGRFPLLFPPGRFADTWTHRSVDSRKVSLTDKASLNEKIAFYGENSNYVRSHIKGEFPTATAETLIATDTVEMAAARDSFVDPRAPVVIGVDVASGHGDDSSCIVVRRGLDARSVKIQRYPGLDPIAFSYKIAVAARTHEANAVFVDATAIGEGCIGKLRELNVPNVHAIYFGGKSDNPNGVCQCANKRAELWVAMAQWLKEGGAIPPDDATLKAELTAPEFSENPRGLIIERKADMRARGLASPDSADALALTFSYPVFTEAMGELLGPGDHRVTSEWNPFSEESILGRPLPESKVRYYAPGYARLKSDDWSSDDLGDAMASDRLRWANEEEDDGWRQ